MTANTWGFEAQRPHCCLWLRESLTHSQLGVERDCLVLALFLCLSALNYYVQLLERGHQATEAFRQPLYIWSCYPQCLITLCTAV